MSVVRAFICFCSVLTLLRAFSGAAILLFSNHGLFLCGGGIKSGETLNTEKKQRTAVTILKKARKTPV